MSFAILGVCWWRHIEDAIKRSGVPYLFLRPSAFMDVWIDQLIADGIRKKGVATIVGPGTRPQNYIVVDDVAEFAVKAIGREEVVKASVDIGGPSDASMNDLATMVERQLQRGELHRLL